MEFVIGVLVVLVLGYGARHFLQARAKKQAAMTARAEKRAKNARADAKAMQKCIDERRQ